MRTPKLMLLLGSLFLLIISCKEEQTDIEKHYEGPWSVTTSDEDMDTTLTMSINAEGQFQYNSSFSDEQVHVVGEVKESGELLGDVEYQGSIFGAMQGTLTTDGTGSGKYYIVNKTIDWTATKK